MGAGASAPDPRGDTIAALATTAGRSALAVVRVSGPDALALAARVSRRVSGDWPPSPREATRVRMHACDVPDDPLDDAILTRYAAPHSATGEDVVEFSLHGGPWISAAVLAALVRAGARPALAGEFTERAVRNGKLDLLQAEGIADLIEARSRAMHRAALKQLSGALSHRLAALRSSLLDVEALIAYEIDFPEEDDGPIARPRVTAAATRALAEIDALLATLPAAELGRDGVIVVLAGAPNAGKSSLFNALLGDTRAIVSEVPGTTRDAIEAMVDADPWPLRLVDTAGLRVSADVVERLGVEVSERRLAGAHLVLVCGESAAELDHAEHIIAAKSPARRLRVRTKADRGGPSPRDVVAVSAATGTGLDALRAAIAAAVRELAPEPADELPVVTRERHASALRIARGELEGFRAAWVAEGLPAPVVATHLRAAVHALDELLGAVDIDEVLERVFRTFCVGK